MNGILFKCPKQRWMTKWVDTKKLIEIDWILQNVINVKLLVTSYYVYTLFISVIVSVADYIYVIE